VESAPGKKKGLLKIKRKRIYMIVGMLVLFLLIPAWVVVTKGLHADKKAMFLPALSRIKGSFSYFVLGHKPKFYYVDVEKNGKDYRLTKNDVLEIRYRDEFVIKDVSTDVIFGQGVTVDVENLGTQNDVRVLLRGIDLVDRTMTAQGMSLSSEHLQAGGINIKYQGEIIERIPMRVAITPQDWLRYAKTSENLQVQIEYLKKAVAASRNDVGVRKMLAALYRRSGMINKSIAQYQEVLALKPNDPAALNELFLCYADARKYDEALKVGLMLVKVNPSESFPYANVAFIYGETGHWGKAIENYKTALKMNPENNTVRYKLAEAYEKTKNFSSAAEYYKQILTKASGDDKAMLALAGACLKAGRYDEAIKWYKEVIRKQPRNASAYANLGLAYGGKGLWNEEIEHYKKAISMNARDPVVQFNLAVAYEKRNLDQEAEQAYDKVLKLTPGDSDAILRLANIAYKNKKYDKAIRLYEKIIKAMPQNASAYANIGFAYGELKKYKLSAENYEKAVRYGIADAQVHQNLAYTYAKLGKKKESIAMYEKCAARRPTIEVLTILAEHYIDEKQYDSAIASYKKMIDLEPRKAAGYSNLAYVYGLKNDPDKEIQYYNMSLKYDPDDSLAYMNLGEAYEKKGLYEEAQKAYRDAYALNPDLTQAAKKIPQMKIKIIQRKHAE